MTEILTTETVQAALRGLPLRAEVYETLESTNDTLKARGRAGEPEGLVILARRQTRGKGRMGRSFFSPDATGLYMSILLRPRLSLEKSLSLTTAAAVSTVKACETLAGRPARIKWVNDIFMDGKKVCGILAESVLGKSDLDFTVLGIGVNICPPPGGFPAELDSIAGTVFSADAAENPVYTPVRLTAALAGEILRQFWTLYEDLQAQPESVPAFLPQYREKMLGLGQKITVLRGEESYPAVLEALDDAFRLVLRREDGTVQTLSSGEIRIKL